MTADPAQLRLWSGPEAQVTPALYREAWPGERCLFCGEMFERLEVVDGLYWYGAHPVCVEDFLSEVDDDEELE